MKDKVFWKVVVVVALILFGLWIFEQRWQYDITGVRLRTNRFTGAVYELGDHGWERR
jgi:hypothetical protein